MALAKSLSRTLYAANDGIVRDSRVAARVCRRRATSVASHGIAVAIVIAVHVAALWALWRYAPTRDSLIEVAPLTFELLAPPAPRVEPPTPEPPRPIVKPRPTLHIPTPSTPAATVAPMLTTPPQPSTESTAAAAPPAPRTPPVDIATPKAEQAPPTPITPPRFDADYLRNPAPPYPVAARRHGEQGRVLLRVLVGENGDARDVEIKSSSGSELLDRTAQETVRRWKFVPARVGSDPVAAWVQVPIVFTLER